VYARRRV